MDAFHPALHDIYEEHADDATIVGPRFDECPQSGVYDDLDPLAALRRWCIGSVIGDEVRSVALSRHGGLGAIDGEQLGCGEPPVRINDIVHCRRSITADMALRIGRALGMSSEFWLNLQGMYDLDVARACTDVSGV